MYGQAQKLSPWYNRIAQNFVQQNCGEFCEQSIFHKNVTLNSNFPKVYSRQFVDNNMHENHILRCFVPDYIPYMAKHSRGNVVRIHRKTFVVAAPFDNECLLLVNHLT